MVMCRFSSRSLICCWSIIERFLVKKKRFGHQYRTNDYYIQGRSLRWGRPQGGLSKERPHFLTNHSEYRHLSKFKPKRFRLWKNHMFLIKHLEYRHLSKFQPKIILNLEKPHVSDKAPGKSPFVQISAQIDFEFGKTTCF